MNYRWVLWKAVQVRTAGVVRHYFLSSCIYFQFRIYKLPSAVGCAHADYLPRENIAVKNSCVCTELCPSDPVVTGRMRKQGRAAVR